MKTLTRLTLLGLLITLSSCGGRNKGVVYNPSNRSAFSSEEEKELAIARKKAEAAGFLPEDVYENAVKLNIMVPKVEPDFPAGAVQVLTGKLLQITAANGIAGYGGNPAFVLASLVNPVKHGLTNTIPQKEYINYIITFYVANIHSGDVFGVLEQEVMGVGSTKEQAAINAMESLTNNEAIAELLRDSSEKIVSWFENHSSSFIAEVDGFVRSGEYDKAYGMLTSVPEAASVCFEYAQKRIEGVHDLYLSQISNMYYQRMKDAVASSDGEYNPEVGAIMEMIPQDAQEYQEAVSLYNKYVANVIDNGNAKKAHEMFMEEETLALEKLRLESEMMAQESLMSDMEGTPSEGGSPNGGFADELIGSVGFGIKTMLLEKAESVILGGVASLLSFI